MKMSRAYYKNECGEDYSFSSIEDPSMLVFRTDHGVCISIANNQDPMFDDQIDMYFTADAAKDLILRLNDKLGKPFYIQGLSPRQIVEND